MDSSDLLLSGSPCLSPTTAGMPWPQMYPIPPTHKAHGVTHQGKDSSISHHLMFLNDVPDAEVPMVKSD